MPAPLHLEPSVSQDHFDYKGKEDELALSEFEIVGPKHMYMQTCILRSTFGIASRTMIDVTFARMSIFDQYEAKLEINFCTNNPPAQTKIT